MRILILGGTRFVGRAIVDAALQRDHEVTLFNRGTHRDIFAAVPTIIGDRESPDDVAELAGARWDAVVDVSAYTPAQLRPVLHALGENVPHYVYISTVSVYADALPRGADESAPLLQVEESISADDPHAYGGLKARCEELLRERLGDRLTVLRPTVVIGPHDHTDRFPWWVRSVARGGTMRVPSRLEQPVQLIDAADLAVFTMHVLEHRVLGTYNTVGPSQPLTLGGLLDALSATFDSHVEPVPAESQEDGAPFPLAGLAADGSEDGLFSVSGAAAWRDGLRLRSIAESALAVRAQDN